jgi:hypothetical protein
MAQTREQISNIIASLNAGDEVRVTWLKSDNTSVETGKVWNPPDSPYWGLGPDLLNPTDLQLVGIRVVKRSTVLTPEPPLGSVAVFGKNDGATLFAVKRLKRGWYSAGDNTALPWLIFIIAYGQPIQTFEPGKVPAKPTIDSVIPGDASLTINLTLGADNGSAIEEIQYNLAFAIPGDPYDQTGWQGTGKTSGPITVSNLTNGTLYEVKVRSLNGRGASPESNMISVLAGTPNAPTIGVITPGNESASVAFTAPTSIGAGAITNYQYQVKEGEDVGAWTTLSPADTTSPITVTGLENGTAYSIRIRAVNASGAGLASAYATVIPASS